MPLFFFFNLSWIGFIGLAKGKAENFQLNKLSLKILEINLKNMQQFYINFPNSYALRSQLTWTHYRLVMRVEDENARNFYLDECIKANWSTRQLERQINTFFYERLLYNF